MLAVFAAGSLFMSSCKKDSDSSSTTSSSTTSSTTGSGFTAQVDGAAWTSAATGATYRYGVFVLSAKSSTGASITLRVKPVAGNEILVPCMMYYGSTDDVGVYMENATDSSGYTTSLYKATGSLLENALTFTKFDAAAKKASGTFTFKVTRLLDNKTKTITGTFTDIVYDTQVPATPGKTMTAKVNGTSWTAASVFGMSLGSSVSITANASNGTTIGLKVPSSATAGDTFEPSTFGTSSAQYNSSGSTVKGAISGSIKITEHDKDAKVMKGSFNFIAEDLLGSGPQDNITDGSFLVTY